MTDHEFKEVSTVENVPGQAQRTFTFKATEVIWLLFGLLEAGIGLRVLFKLIAVNPANPFAALLYRITDLFLFPFAGLVGTPEAGGMVLEISSIIAMIIYALIGWALERTIYVLFYRPREGASIRQTTVHTDRHDN